MLEFIVKYWAQWLFGIVAAGLTAAYRNLSKKIKAQKEENKAIKKRSAGNSPRPAVSGVYPLHRERVHRLARFEKH